MNGDVRVDVIVGLAWGDEGKGKISSLMSRTGGLLGNFDKKYDFVCRWAGGPNAGHTVYLHGRKYKTHHIPSGVFFGIPSIIGPGCVVNIPKFLAELKYLEDNGFDSSLVKVSPLAHIILEEHIKNDKKHSASTLGTTSNGIGPCYSSKANRTGIRASDLLDQKYLWDGKLYGSVLCEGAQGVWLDLDAGNYPYVTSSTTLPHAACSLGFNVFNIKNIIGVVKIYDTRSGKDPDFPPSLFDDKLLSRIGDLGQEFGVTTGRRRSVNWLNLNKLIKAINLTGTTQLVINKCDILQELGVYKLYYDGILCNFNSFFEMKAFIKDTVGKHTKLKGCYCYFSGDKEFLFAADDHSYKMRAY